MKSSSILAAVAVTTIMAQPLAAQSVPAFDQERASDVRATIGITIPFGGQRREAVSQPRLDISFDRRNEHHGTLLSVNPVRNFEQPEWRRMSLSVTLEQDSRLLLNGSQLAQFNSSLHADEQDKAETDRNGGANTALIVGGVVLGALLVATVATTADAADALNDLVDPD